MKMFEPIPRIKDKIEVEIHNIWIVVSNTDLTEGRGWETIVAYCFSQTTAERLAKGKGVQGCNAHVRPAIAYKQDNQWYAPITSIQIHYPSDEDRKVDELKKKKQEVRNKALSLGLTEEELKLLYKEEYTRGYNDARDASLKYPE